MSGRWRTRWRSADRARNRREEKRPKKPPAESREDGADGIRNHIDPRGRTSRYERLVNLVDDAEGGRQTDNDQSPSRRWHRHRFASDMPEDSQAPVEGNVKEVPVMHLEFETKEEQRP